MFTIRNKSYIEKKIDIIKDNKSFGALIEVGAGCPVYNQLTLIPNTASKIVQYAESPNNWDYSKHQYSIPDNIRAVSAEVLQKFLTCHSSSDNNFVLANTIQVANDQKTQTHGWFALKTKTSEKYYHFSINGFKTRKQYSEIIAEIGLDILASLNDYTKIDNGYIDLILDHNLSQNLYDTLYVLINSVGMQNTSLIYQDYKISRLNELMRTNNDLLLFKGSFNPIHPHHIDLINECYNNQKIVLCISVNNRNTEKKVDVDNLINRIQLLNELGYTVMLDRFGHYKNTYKNIVYNSDYNNHDVTFIMGADIMKRFLLDENVYIDPKINDISLFNTNFRKAKFIYSDRKGTTKLKIDKALNISKVNIDNNDLSSTLIRKALISNFEKSLDISDRLINLYKKYYKNDTIRI